MSDTSAPPSGPESNDEKITRAMLYEAMMEDIGLGRLEELHHEDKNGSGGPIPSASAATRARSGRGIGSGYEIVQEDIGLSDIGGGQSHRARLEQELGRSSAARGGHSHGRGKGGSQMRGRGSQRRLEFPDGNNTGVKTRGHYDQIFPRRGSSRLSGHVHAQAQPRSRQLQPEVSHERFLAHPSDFMASVANTTTANASNTSVGRLSKTPFQTVKAGVTAAKNVAKPEPETGASDGNKKPTQLTKPTGFPESVGRVKISRQVDPDRGQVLIGNGTAKIVPNDDRTLHLSCLEIVAEHGEVVLREAIYRDFAYTIESSTISFIAQSTSGLRIKYILRYGILEDAQQIGMELESTRSFAPFRKSRVPVTQLIEPDTSDEKMTDANKLNNTANPQDTSSARQVSDIPTPQEDLMMEKQKLNKVYIDDEGRVQGAGLASSQYASKPVQDTKPNSKRGKHTDGWNTVGKSQQALKPVGHTTNSASPYAMPSQKVEKFEDTSAQPRAKKYTAEELMSLRKFATKMDNPLPADYRPIKSTPKREIPTRLPPPNFDGVKPTLRSDSTFTGLLGNAPSSKSNSVFESPKPAETVSLPCVKEKDSRSHGGTGAATESKGRGGSNSMLSSRLSYFRDTQDPNEPVSEDLFWLESKEITSQDSMASHETKLSGFQKFQNPPLLFESPSPSKFGVFMEPQESIGERHASNLWLVPHHANFRGNTIKPLANTPRICKTKNCRTGSNSSTDSLAASENEIASDSDEELRALGLSPRKNVKERLAMPQAAVFHYSPLSSDAAQFMHPPQPVPEDPINFSPSNAKNTSTVDLVREVEKSTKTVDNSAILHKEMLKQQGGLKDSKFANTPEKRSLQPNRDGSTLYAGVSNPVSRLNPFEISQPSEIRLPTALGAIHIGADRRASEVHFPSASGIAYSQHSLVPGRREVPLGTQSLGPENFNPFASQNTSNPTTGDKPPLSPSAAGNKTTAEYDVARLFF